MRRGHRLISLGTLFMVLVASGTSPVRAQDSAPPDLHMLLDLDLFRSLQRGEKGWEGSSSNDSTLDQIRTLNALGYLGNSDNARASGESSRSQTPATPLPQETPE
jgi:hypothetical protein